MSHPNESASEWRPIETAPKDGTMLWLRCKWIHGKYQTQRGHWFTYCMGSGWFTYNAIGLDPSHFRPIIHAGELPPSPDLPSPSLPKAETPWKCAECGAPLNSGEATTFTVCDKCWEKAYGKPAGSTSEGVTPERIEEIRAGLKRQIAIDCGKLPPQPPKVSDAEGESVTTGDRRCAEECFKATRPTDDWELLDDRETADDQGVDHAAASIARHRAAAVREERRQWETWGTIEIAIRNPNVSSYMEHWEGRTTKAEAELAKLTALSTEQAHTIQKLSEELVQARKKP